MKIEMNEHSANAVMVVALCVAIIVLFLAMGGAFK